MGLKGFIENSLLDWDGRLSAVLFLSGCNYACPFCHNPELATDSPALKELELETVLCRLAALQHWLDGVVVTGGEPCIFGRLEMLLRMLKERGFAVKLDTNGSRPDVLKDLLGKGLADYVAMDVKAPLVKEKYAQLAGCAADPALPLESVAILREAGVPHEFRTTVVPGLLSAEDLQDIARALGPKARYFLQGFKSGRTLSRELDGTKSCGEEFLQQAAAACGRYVAGCGVRS